MAAPRPCLPVPCVFPAVSRTGRGRDLAYQPARNRYVLHLVNHNYAANRIVPQTALSATLDLAMNPASVTLISPDTAAPASVPFTRSGNTLTIAVGELLYYDVLVIE